MGSQRNEDLDLLRRLVKRLAAAAARVDEVDEADKRREWLEKVAKDLETFEGMLHRLVRVQMQALSDKQRNWAADVLEKIGGEPVYRNDFSAGKVPLGTALKTAVPDVLKRPLPKRPPGRI
jgi:hypothetical protein